MAVSGAITERRRAGGATANLGLFIEDDWQIGPLVINGGLRADRSSITGGFYNAVSAAGVTPSIRAACPKVSGRALPSRSTISRDSPPIAA